MKKHLSLSILDYKARINMGEQSKSPKYQSAQNKRIGASFLWDGFFFVVLFIS